MRKNAIVSSKPNIVFFTRNISVTSKDINKLWLVFSKYDREGIGLITRNDIFEKLLQEPRNTFGDALFELIGMKYDLLICIIWGRMRIGGVCELW